MPIQSIKPENDGLNIFWNDGSSSCFPWLWLRDHSESKNDLHPDSKQRQIDVFSEKPDNSIIDAILDQNAKNIMVQWRDKSNSYVSFDLLESLASTSHPSAQALASNSFWNFPNEMKVFSEMSYDDFMKEGKFKKMALFWLIMLQLAPRQQ